jgi:hypothetical protein
MSGWLNGLFSNYGTAKTNGLIPLCCMGFRLIGLDFLR